jgi:hypothetical protein
MMSSSAVRAYEAKEGEARQPAQGEVDSRRRRRSVRTLRQLRRAGQAAVERQQLHAADELALACQRRGEVDQL